MEKSNCSRVQRRAAGKALRAVSDELLDTKDLASMGFCMLLRSEAMQQYRTSTTQAALEEVAKAITTICDGLGCSYLPSALRSKLPYDPKAFAPTANHIRRFWLRAYEEHGVFHDATSFKEAVERRRAFALKRKEDKHANSKSDSIPDTGTDLASYGAPYGSDSPNY